MSASVPITSTHNERVKHLLALQQKASLRRSSGFFVVEGLRELTHCLEGGWRLHSLFICPDLFHGDAARQVLSSLPADVPCYEVSARVYEKMAYRHSTEGIVALVHARHITLGQLPLSPSPLIIVVEQVEKPGNIGAILRSADAAGADAVVVCDPLTDLYNPNIIRSSIGAVFTVPCVACTSEECIAFLKRQGIQILTAQLQDSLPYYSTDMRRPTAIVMGTEATGLTQRWRDAADRHILIPMQGAIDSLNVSVSAAILLFEAVRQRCQATD